MKDKIVNAIKFAVVFFLLICATSCVGSKGEKGEKGEKGDTGAQGLQGETGPMGSFDPSKLYYVDCPPKGGGDGNTYMWCICNNRDPVIDYYVQCYAGDSIGKTNLVIPDNVGAVCRHPNNIKVTLHMPPGFPDAEILIGVKMEDRTPESMRITCSNK